MVAGAPQLMSAAFAAALNIATVHAQRITAFIALDCFIPHNFADKIRRVLQFSSAKNFEHAAAVDRASVQLSLWEMDYPSGRGSNQWRKASRCRMFPADLDGKHERHNNGQCRISFQGSGKTGWRSLSARY